MPITKPTTGSTGWDTAVDAVIDLVNDLEPVATSGLYSDLSGAPRSRMFDARDYGTGNNSAAINLASAAAVAAGGGTVYIPSIPGGWTCTRSITGDNQSGAIVLRSGVTFRFDNPTLNLTQNCAFVVGRSTFGTSVTITGDTVVGDTNLTVASSAGFTVGQDVFVWIGQAAYDAFEPDQWLYAKVTAVPDSTHVTLDQPVNYALSIAAVTDVNQRRIAPVTSLLENVRIEGTFYCNNPMSGGGNAEEGIYIEWARNLYIESIRARNPGAAAVNLRYVDTATIDTVEVTTSARQNGQTSKGRGFSLAECRNIEVGNLNLRDCEGPFILMESRCEAVTIHNLRVNNTHAGHNDTTQAIISQVGNVRARYENVWVDGRGSYFYSSGQSQPGSEADFVNVHFNTPTDPIIESLVDFSGMLRVRGRVYRELRRFSKRIRLTPNMAAVDVALPSGLCRRIKVFATSTTGITNIQGRSSSNSASFSSQLVAGSTVDLTRSTSLTGLGGASYPFNAGEAKALRITTDGTVPSGAYLAVDMDYFVSKATTDDGTRGALEDTASLDTDLAAWTYADAFQLVAMRTPRDVNGAITSADVRWPDGSTGIFTTTTASSALLGALDAYTVTYVPPFGPTRTVTQPAVTRDASGAVTAQPAITVV